MRWASILLILLIPLISKRTFGQEIEELESTTLTTNEISNNVSPTTSNKGVELNEDLRNALLKALKELENDESTETVDSEDEEKTVEKAQASAITYYEEQDSESRNQENYKQTDTTEQDVDSENKKDETDNPTVVKATQIVVQKSDGIQSGTVTSIETEPINFLKDAEQIISSSSNSFVAEDTDTNNSLETRSVKNTEPNIKSTSFANFNTITNFDTKSPQKTIVEKFSIGKAVDEPTFVRSYVSPLGNSVNDKQIYGNSAGSNVNNFNSKNQAYVKTSTVGGSSKASVTSNVKNVDSGSSISTSNGEVSTEAPVEVSTEENEAKVEQVQFFSAPLVAAFTVHQDEKGLPKKVEPIYKNEITSKKQQESSTQSAPQHSFNIQSSNFNNLDLQKKQQILEQELQKLRNQQLLQQEFIYGRNNVNNQEFNNNFGFTQTGFNRAVSQHFNQYDPIFTEPDRSVVTKLATIDPSNLLAHNGGPILNKFTVNEAILPATVAESPNFANKPVPETKPIVQNNNQGEVTLVPSITYDPIIEAGKLPFNAQILPNKEPTGFFKIVPPSNTQSSQSSSKITSQPNPSLVSSISTQSFPQTSFNSFASNTLPVTQQNIVRPNNLIQPNHNFVQSTSSNIQPSVQNTAQNSNANFLINNQAYQAGFNQNQNNQNSQFLTANRILRQEQGTGNLGINNQNAFSIIPSHQPFKPTHELGYFPDNRFLRQNQESTLTQPQNFGGQRTGLLQNNVDLTRNVNTQSHLSNDQNQYQINQNRFLRSNLEGTVTGFNNFKSVQPFGAQSFSQNSQPNRFFRSNPESSLASVQNYRNTQNIFSQPQNVGQNTQNNRFLRSNLEGTFGASQSRFAPQPFLQNYRYRNSFGF